MFIFIVCNCGTKLRVRKEHADVVSECPECQTKLHVPPADFFDQNEGRTFSIGQHKAAPGEGQGEKVRPLTKVDAKPEESEALETIPDVPPTVHESPSAFADTVQGAVDSPITPDAMADTVPEQPSPVEESAGNPGAFADTVPEQPSPVGKPAENPDAFANTLPEQPSVIPEKASGSESLQGEFPIPEVRKAKQQSTETWEEGAVVESKYKVFGSARGAMGRVYFVEHLQWQEQMAIKTILPKGGEVSERRLKRFRRETEAWINLGKHPNLVTAFYLRQIEGRYGLFLEYVDGDDLHQWIHKTENRDFGEILDIAIQICDGMAHAHARGIIHRDLKPGNILLSTDRLAKVTDFGLVLLVDEEDAITSPNKTVGTPAYMAPEQFIDSQNIDARADIYSFGLILHMMISGDYVFQPDRKMERREMMLFFREAHLNTPPESLKDRRPETPDTVAEVVMRCLAKEPAQRYPDFAAARANLVDVYKSVTGEKSPRQQILAPDLNSADLNNRALTFFDLEETDKALQFLEEAYEVDPGSPVVCANLATMWAEQNLPSQEFDTCVETARAGTGGDPDVALRLAEACLKFGGYEEAQGLAQKVIAHNTRSSAALNLLAGVAHARGHVELADQRVREALALNSADADFLHNKALCDFESENAPAAAQGLLQAMNASPDDAELAADLAVVLAEAGRMDDALNWCRHALNLEPDGYWANLSAAEILAGLRGNVKASYLDQALKIFQRLHNAYPMQWRVRDGFNHCLLASGSSVSDSLFQPLSPGTAHAKDLKWARLVRSGRPAAFDMNRIKSGHVEFGPQGERHEWYLPLEERLRDAGPGAQLMSVSPNRLWLLTWEGTHVRLRNAINMALICSLGMDEGVLLTAAGISGQSSAPASCAWSTDSRFCMIQSSDGSQRIFEFSTASDFPLSPFRVASSGLILDRSSSASESIELLKQRSTLLSEAKGAELRWDHSTAFKNYRDVQKLRGFERDFDAHAGATRAANWMTAPAGINNAWERKKFPLRDYLRSVRTIEILADGKRGMTLSDDGRLRFYDLITGQVIWSLEGEFGWVQELFISPETNACVLKCSDRILRHLNLNNQVIFPIFLMRHRELLQLCLDESGTGFFSFSRAGELEHWRLEPQTDVKLITQLDSPWKMVLFSASRETFLAISASEGALLGKLETGNEVQRFNLQRPSIEDMVVCLSPSGEKVLTNGAIPTNLEFWDAHTGERIKILTAHEQPITALAIDSKGRTAVAGCKDGRIKLWDLFNGRELWTFGGHVSAITALKFSPNDEFFLSGDAEGKLKFWTLDWAWEMEES
ncbi:MAG: protein kinase [Planctomycetota bacterium]|nr:protein kinase [Planctomycetota bacterium]